MTDDATNLVLHSDAEEVPRLQSHLLTLCVEAGLDHLAAFQFTCAIVEAVNNCIEHAYCGEAGHQISLRWLADPKNIVVEVRDTGRAMLSDAPRSAGGAGELDVDALSGRGWHIIRQWTDNAVYSSEQNGNLLTLTRRL